MYVNVFYDPKFPFSVTGPFACWCTNRDVVPERRSLAEGKEEDPEGIDTRKELYNYRLYNYNIISEPNQINKCSVHAFLKAIP